VAEPEPAPHHLAVRSVEEEGGRRLEVRLREDAVTTTLDLVHHLTYHEGLVPG
jgi:hypothetical protein